MTLNDRRDVVRCIYLYINIILYIIMIQVWILAFYTTQVGILSMGFTFIEYYFWPTVWLNLMKIMKYIIHYYNIATAYHFDYFIFRYLINNNTIPYPYIIYFCFGVQSENTLNYIVCVDIEIYGVVQLQCIIYCNIND